MTTFGTLFLLLSCLVQPQLKTFPLFFLCIMLFSLAKVFWRSGIFLKRKREGYLEERRGGSRGVQEVETMVSTYNMRKTPFAMQNKKST